MSKLRSVSTSFWSDPFIEDLTPNEKLLFLYLITNDKTNMLGIYEVSIKKISFDTGLNKDVIEKALKEFERLSKVKYIKNHIVLVNFMKHQNYNTNMKKSAIDIYNELPNELKNKELSISKDNPLKGFESLLNHYGMVPKVEYEEEEEIELEKEGKELFLLEKETKEENLSKENPIEIFPQSESVEPGAEERKKVAPKKERSEEKLKMPDDFIEIWEEWKEYRKAKQFKSYAGLKWEQMAVDKLLELSNKNPTIAKLILKQTYENSYQGFFPLKQNSNGITNTKQSGFSNNGAVSTGKVSGRSIVADRISQHLARNSESGNHTIDIEANIVR